MSSYRLLFELLDGLIAICFSLEPLSWRLGISSSRSRLCMRFYVSSSLWDFCTNCGGLRRGFNEFVASWGCEVTM